MGTRARWRRDFVFNPSATSRLPMYLWNLEQSCRRAVANEYFIGAINRVGIEPSVTTTLRLDLLRQSPRAEGRRGRQRHQGRVHRARP